VCRTTITFHPNKLRGLHLIAVAKASSVPERTRTAVLASSGAANPTMPGLKCSVLSFSPTLAGRDFTYSDMRGAPLQFPRNPPTGKSRDKAFGSRRVNLSRIGASSWLQSQGLTIPITCDKSIRRQRTTPCSAKFGPLRTADLFLSSEIHAFIAQQLKVDVASMDAHSHLIEDFGLDLFEITALLTVLEERFGVDPETADEPNRIELVGDLIRYIESSTNGEKLKQTG
jgi:acyl carrier protein